MASTLIWQCESFKFGNKYTNFYNFHINVNKISFINVNYHIQYIHLKTCNFGLLQYLAVRCQPRLFVEERTLTYNGLLLQIVTSIESCLFDSDTTFSSIY